MPVALWSDSVWVFVDYNNAGKMERLLLSTGATLIATSAPGTGRVVKYDVNNSVSDVNNSVSDVDNPVSDVNNSVSDVNNPVSDVNNSVSDVNNSVSDVNNPVSDVNNSVSDVNNSVSDVNNPVSDVNNSVSGNSGGCGTKRQQTNGLLIPYAAHKY